MPQTDETTPSSKLTNLEAAVDAVSQLPGDDTLWDAAEDLVAETQTPEPLAELYAQVLERDLGAPALRALSSRALRFIEEWFSDETQHALDVLTRVFARDPADGVLLERLALGLSSAGQWATLMDAYDAALDATDSLEEKAKLLAEAARVAKDVADDVDRAVGYLERLLPLRPHDAQLRQSLERLLEKEERWSQLIDLWESGLEGLPDDEAALLSVRIAGCWLQKLHNPPAAVDVLVGAVAKYGDHEAVCAALEHAAALEDSSRSARAAALSCVRDVYRSGKRGADLARVLRIGIEFEEGSAQRELLRELVATARELAEHGEVLTRLGQLLQLSPDDDAVVEEVGAAAEVCGDAEAHVEILRKSAEAAGDAARHDGLLQRAAEVAESAGLATQAAAAYRGLLDEGCSAEVRRNAGQALVRLLRAQDEPSDERLHALRALSALTSDASEWAVLVGERAELLAARREYEQARSAWQERLDKEPADAEALDGLVEVLRAAERWRPLVTALRERVEQRSDDTALRARDLAELASIQVGPLEDLRAALSTWKELQASAPKVAEQTRGAEIATYNANLVFQDAAGLQLAVAESLRDVWGDARGAVAHYVRALHMRPESEEAQAGLRAALSDAELSALAAEELGRAFRELGHVDGQLEVLQARVAATPDPRQRRALWLSASLLSEGDKDDPARAFEQLCEAFLCLPADPGCDDDLARLAEKTLGEARHADVLREGRALLDPGPRATLLLEREAVLREAQLLDLEGALLLYRELHESDRKREPWGHAACRLALSLNQCAAAAAVLVGTAEATGRVPESLLTLFEGERGHGEADACAALESALAEAELVDTVRRSVHVRLGRWCEQAGVDPDLTERVWARALAAGRPDADILGHLVEIRRRRADRDFYDTLMAQSELLDDPAKALREAAETAHRSLSEDALWVRALRPLLAFTTSARARMQSPEESRETAAWAVKSLAKAYEKAEDTTALLEVLRIGASLDPSDDDTLRFGLRAAQLADTLGDRSAALASYERLFEQRPDHADTTRALVGMYEQGERDQDALLALERALAVAPRGEWRSELRLWLARVAGRIEARDPRVAVLRDNLRDQPGDVRSLAALEGVLRGRGDAVDWQQTLMQQAEAVRAEGQSEQAVELYRRAATMARDELSDDRSALAGFVKLAELAPSAEVFDAVAKLHERRQESQPAQLWLSRLLDQKPDEVSVRLRLAAAYEAGGDLDATESCLRAGVQLQPTSMPLRDALAVLLQRRERPAALAELLADTVQHTSDPVTAVDHARRASKLFAELGTQELGVSMLERAVGMAPDDRALECAFADALMAGGALDRARNLLEGMAAAYGRRRSPERAEIHLRLSRVARAAGNTEEALTQLDAAAGMSRGDIGTLRTLAQLAEEAGEWDRAERALRSLLMTARRSQEGDQPISSSEVQYGLHRIAKARGQDEKAEELLQSALETAAQSEQESELFKVSLLSSGEPELLLKVLEMRLSSVKDAVMEARVLADLADVLEGPLARPEEALDARMKALTAAPSVRELRDEALRLSLKLGVLSRYTSALSTLLERARRKDDVEEAVAVAMQLGEVFENQSNDLAEARQAYAKVGLGSSRYVDAQMALARVSGKEGRSDEERAVLTGLIESPIPDDARMRARYRLLELAVQEPDARDEALDSVQVLLSQFPGSHAEAARVLGVATDSQPDDGRAPALLEEVCRQSENPALLLSFFERHASRAHASLDLIREGVELAREHGELLRARALCERAVELTESGSGLIEALWAPVALAHMARDAGEMEGALRWLERAVSAAEGEEGFTLGIELAQMAAGQGERDLSVRTYEQLRQREPGERRVYRPLFTLYREADDLAATEALTRATVEALLGSEERNELRADLAEMAFAADNAELAEGVLREGLEDDPDDERCSTLLADHLQRQGRRSDLADLLGRKLEHAHARRSESIVPLSLRMGSLLEDSRPGDAVQVYRTALSIAPADPGLLKATVRLMDPASEGSDRAQLVERLLEHEPPEDAPQMALWLLDHAARFGGDGDVERAMALGFKVAPGDESLRSRLEQWYRDRGNWEKLSGLLVTQAEREQDESRAVAMMCEAAELFLDRLGQPERAAELLREARERDPNSTDLMRLATLSSVRAGQVEQALAGVDAALANAKKKKERAPLHLLRAEALAAAGDPLAAVDDLESAYKLGGPSLAERLVQGLMRARGAAEANGDAERERALLMRGLEVGDGVQGLDAQVEQLASWSQRHPEDLDAAVRLLTHQTNLGAHAEAVATAERVIETASLQDVQGAAQQLRAAAEAMGQPTAAMPGLERAMARFPEDPGLSGHLVEIYEAVGAHEQLAGLLLRHLPPVEQTEERFAALQRAGHMLLAAQRPGEAMPALEEALSLKPDDHATRMMVIDAHIEGGNYLDAQRLIEAAIEGIRARRSPELAELRHRMSVLCDKAGDERARYEWLAVALEADMNNGIVAAETAILAQALGEVDTALKALRAVTMLKTECPMGRAEAFLRQAQIVAHKGETRRAALWAKKAKAEDPEFPGVDELLEKLSG